MDERAARRLELVKKDDLRTSSGVLSVPAQRTDGSTTASLSITTGITTGMVLDGKYLVGRIIGSGAVGIVFEAKNVELDETVAIKCLRPEMLVDRGMVARFAREAKAAAAIKSEYVATVHDVGTTEDGVPYIVMEYLDGKDLGAVVAESGMIGPRTAVEYALQVCEALAVAHSKGIVHRDIKPENLLLTERAGGMRIVKVLDFGISKMALTGSIFQSELPLVKTVNLMGTPLYMSPEQVRASDSVDVRSDVWSLGMVIYEILTGQTAFGGQSITEICAAILESRPNPIDVHRSDIPSGLVEIIQKCLEKDVAARYQNIAELALALLPFGPKRTRLNVERAVAVLQGSGHVDPQVRLNSTVPPSPSDFKLTPIPRPPNAPVISGMPSPTPSAPMIAPASSERSPAGLGPSLVVSEGKEATTFEPKKRRIGFIVGAIAVLLIAGGVVAVTVGRSTKPKPAAAAAPEAKASPPPTVANQNPTTATATATATTPTTAATNPATTTATATPTKPAAPRPGAHPAKPGAAPAAPASKPKASKPTDEPDLGY